jgi:hypothetical protein
MSDFEFPDEFQLPQVPQYFETEDDPLAVSYCAARNALLDKILGGKLYVKFIAGDRKGSIAKVQMDPEVVYGRAVMQSRSWQGETQYMITNPYIFGGIAKWDKRKNSCQLSLPDASVIFLPNYTGPTVYEMFDRKAAKNELLKDPDQRDIDGKLLSVGDQVLYINARYGSGFLLCHGAIKEFKVVADSKGHSFTTIVKNDEGDEESSISYPTQMIWKK